jgi:hypothetical protein
MKRREFIGLCAATAVVPLLPGVAQAEPAALVEPVYDYHYMTYPLHPGEALSPSLKAAANELAGSLPPVEQLRPGSHVRLAFWQSKGGRAYFERDLWWGSLDTSDIPVESLSWNCNGRQLCRKAELIHLGVQFGARNRLRAQREQGHRGVLVTDILKDLREIVMCWSQVAPDGKQPLHKRLEGF